MPEFDMDPSESDLRIGLEVEYPKGVGWGDERFKKRARKSSDLQSAMSSEHVPSQYGRVTYDGTVGLEQVSDVLELEDAPGWYADVIEYIEEEFNVPFGYTSLLNGSTAGLHMHLSPLSRSQARELYEISLEPWAQALFCSAIVSDESGDDWSVFRDNNYARQSFDERRYSIVHRAGTDDHWEWRMPEPMLPENLEITVKFLRLFEQDPQEAVRYAQGLLDDADDRITSIRRAEIIGIDVADIPEVYRRPQEGDHDFFHTVADEWAAPEIFQVHVPNDETDADTFFALRSQMQGTMELEGYTFDVNGVYYADEITPVEDEEVQRIVRSALSRHQSGDIRQSEATEEVKKALKKKKKAP